MLIEIHICPSRLGYSLNIRQFLQGHLKRKASFPDTYGGSQLGLIALIGAAETYANIPCVEIQMTGRGRCVRIDNALAFEDAVLGRILADEVRERTAAQQHSILKDNDAAGRPIHPIEPLRGD